MRIGRQVLSPVSGVPVQVLAEPQGAAWKAGGITVDWNTVAAVNADTSLPDGNIIRKNKKGFRFGQILCKITNPEIQTITVTSGTGGTFTAAGSGAMAYNISAADMKTALELIFGTGKITSVTLSGGVYTVTFDNSLGNVATMAIVDSTTGSGHSVAAATVNQGSGTVGYYGPYDPAATDGRATLTRGSCYIVNRTFLEEGMTDLLGTENYLAVFEGGSVWRARLLVTSGSHSLAAGPTFTEFEAVFPLIRYVNS
jgi:hypothetical protein